MDIAPTSTATTNNNNNTNPPKSPDPETETSPQPTATRIQPAKPLSSTNGVLKRHHPHHHHHHHHHHLAPPVVITYKECLKNHAAPMGGHALDGCGEFLPSPTATASDPTSLKCAACGCHRNFHRREPEDSPPHNTTTTTTIEYQPHHRHHPPPPPTAAQANRSPNSASPPPISSSYYPSAPHMLLALSGGVGGLNENAMIGGLGGNSTRKRFRTKFSQSQKERMYQFAERVGWKMQKKDEELVQSFCNEVGVDKGVLKVWMHNNKNTFGKRSEGNGNVRIASNGSNGNDNDHNVVGDGDNTNVNGNNYGDNHHKHHRFENDNVGHMGTNGSSSSS